MTLTKVAVLVSGELRLTASSLLSQRHFLADELNADVFVFGWNSTGRLGNSTRSIGWRALPRRRLSERDKRTLEILRPRAVMLQEFRAGYFDRIGSVARPQVLKDLEPAWSRGLLPMAYCMHKCFRLMEASERASGHQYDFLARIRPDLVFHRPLSGELLSSDSVLASNYLVDTRHQVSDKFLIGPRHQMRHVFELFRHLDGYFKSLTRDTPWEQRPVGERLMKRHLGLYGVPVRFADFGVSIPGR